MSDKLDPNLRALLESAGATAAASAQQEPVPVIVGLSAPASPMEIDALRERGLNVRSVIGDVLTGTVPLAKISRVADHGLVTKIEASTPLYPEKSSR